MRSHYNTSIAVPESKREDFEQGLEEVMEKIGASSRSEAIVKLVLVFERMYFEAQMYRKFFREINAFEALWEKKNGRDSSASIDMV